MLDLIGLLLLFGLVLGFGAAAGLAGGLVLAALAVNKVVVWLERKGILP